MFGENKQISALKFNWNRIILLASILVFFILAFLIWKHINNSPNIHLLTKTGKGQWILPDREYQLKTWPREPLRALYRCSFSCQRLEEGIPISVRTFKKLIIFLIDNEIYGPIENAGNWKIGYEIALPSLSPGKHEIAILVENTDGPPALCIDSPLLELCTGKNWNVELILDKPIPVRLATDRFWPKMAMSFPTVPQAVLSVVPYLAIIFLGFWIMFFWGKTIVRQNSFFNSTRLEPSMVKTIIAIACLILAVNNAFRLPIIYGFDTFGHLAYINFICEKWKIPLACDGWEMFQSPLYYMIEAPILMAVKGYGNERLIFFSLRLLSAICIIAQVEIIYRIAIQIFPRQKDLQIIAIIVSGFMPMSLYMSSVISNEPLAGILSSMVILLFLPMFLNPKKQYPLRTYVFIGAVWGFALLAKVTPVLLSVPMAIVFIRHAIRSRLPIFSMLSKGSLIIGTAIIICGWYYLRNLIELGSVFVSNWSPEGYAKWWQEPGYRTIDEYLTFGSSLYRPIYVNMISIWDGIYATLWLDGQISGAANTISSPPWNYNWMIAGAWLALIPSSLMIAAIPRLFFRNKYRIRIVLLGIIVCLTIYTSALLFFTLTTPNFSTIKSFYLLGIIPGLGIISAIGCEPLLKTRFLRATIFSGLICWAITAYAAYFCIK
jgi:hypothetical protein